MERKKIRRFWLWVGILLLVELAAITLWKRWYWFFPSNFVSEAYSKYAGTEGINAAFFKDYHINDTVTVDVTLLEATDSNGWNLLSEDFKISRLDSVTQKIIDNGKDLIFSKRLNKNNLSEQIDDTNAVIIRTVSYINKAVSIFHTSNEMERQAVLYYNFDKSTNLPTPQQIMTMPINGPSSTPASLSSNYQSSLIINHFDL